MNPEIIELPSARVPRAVLRPVARIVAANVVRAPASAPARTSTPSLPGAGESRARLSRIAQYAVLPVSVLAVWTLVSHLQLLPANILPSPLVVLATFRDLLTGDYGEKLSYHLGVSLWRVARGAAIGVPLGLLLGLALGFSPTAESWFGPAFRAFAQIPSITLIPLLMMFLGIDDRLKLFIMAKSCVIPLTLVTADGIRNIPTAYLEVGEVFRLRRWTRIRRIVLQGALPSIFTGIRQGIAHVWVSLVAVEVLASAEGIGYLMTWGRLIFQLDVVLVCVAVIGAIGLLLDIVMRKVEARLLVWRGTSQ
ncbi:MAG: ABC transporter permease [Opitutaceae bacterium]|jgi:sulfonate transport system permease protein